MASSWPWVVAVLVPVLFQGTLPTAQAGTPHATRSFIFRESLVDNGNS